MKKRKALWIERNLKQLLPRYFNQRAPQALLLYGREGIGKAESAKAMSHALLCLNSSANQPEPCELCQSCGWFLQGTHPDYTLLTGEEQIKVEQIRKLIEQAHITSETGRKIVQIDRLERLNINAANALLKLLEEPPANLYFILTTNVMGRLPMTILSRCQKVPAIVPSREEGIRWLLDSGVAEQNIAEALLSISYGAPFRALQYYEADFKSEVAEIDRLLTALLNYEGRAKEITTLMEHHPLLFDLLLYGLSAAVKGELASLDLLPLPEVIPYTLKRLTQREALKHYEALLEINRYREGQARTDWQFNSWLNDFIPSE